MNVALQFAMSRLVTIDAPLDRDLDQHLPFAVPCDVIDALCQRINAANTALYGSKTPLLSCTLGGDDTVQVQIISRMPGQYVQESAFRLQATPDGFVAQTFLTPSMARRALHDPEKPYFCDHVRTVDMALVQFTSWADRNLNDWGGMLCRVAADLPVVRSYTGPL